MTGLAGKGTFRESQGSIIICKEGLKHFNNEYDHDIAY